MEIEITEQQFNLVQNEIIRIEEEIPFLRDDKDSWGVIHAEDRILELKQIIKTEKFQI